MVATDATWDSTNRDAVTVADLQQLETELGHRVVVQAARSVLQSLREGITSGKIKEFSATGLGEETAAAAEHAGLKFSAKLLKLALIVQEEQE